jgi:pimeloyl-ACP methyl ester carboxylesterase
MWDSRELAVPSGDVTLHAEVSGSGPQLLFFNGSGASIATAMPLLSYLARSFTVAVADQRGLGKTGSPANAAGFTMAAYARDGAALLDALGWERTRVLGVSFGGMVAQEFAVTWPERVERLVLACTSSGGAGGASYPLHELDKLPASERAAVALRNLDTRFTHEWLASHPDDQRIVDEMAAGAMVDVNSAQLAGRAGQLEARRHHDTFDRLSRITCPTLVMAGRFDGLAPVANSEAIVSQIPGAQLELFDGGHMFLRQDPRSLGLAVEFLGQ